MTIRATNKELDQGSQKFYRLSIQISLNGLSFCVLDTLQNQIVSSEKVHFHKELTPYELLKELRAVFESHRLAKEAYEEVVVLHRNSLFSMVPKALFNASEMANYLKFNARILANDHIAFDELEEHGLVNVYVPFVNINNFVYEHFGEFVYKHHGTVLVQSLMNEPVESKEPVVYVHVFEKEMDLTVVDNKKLLLFNTFTFETYEDFLYYLLFTLEQLRLDTDTVNLKLLGDVEQDDALFQTCYTYIKQVSLCHPNKRLGATQDHAHLQTIDFTVLNAL